LTLPPGTGRLLTLYTNGIRPDRHRCGTAQPGYP
jgi:hypothetical protein